MTTPGSSTLTGEQGDWMLDRYGVRYVGVQDNADVASRRQRRAQKRRKRKRPNGQSFGG